MKFTVSALVALSVASVNGFVSPQQPASFDRTLSVVRASKDVPSMAQTHFQGPLTVMGSGKPLTKEDLDQVKEELEQIKEQYGWKEPDRAFMDDPDIDWRFGGTPDYSLVNLQYLKGRSKIHPEGSLELVVENLVKTWEMERSHKVDPGSHQSVDTENFRISANGGKVFDNEEANAVGNYNVLLNACPADLWDSENITWENSHDTFHNAFAAFPWEVLDVFSGPPKVAFTWRHWGQFTGTYEDNEGKGELVEMFGFGTAVVNDKLQLQDVEIYYNAEDFINVLRGETKVENTNANWKSTGGCPFQAASAILTKSLPI
ncbi:Inherit from NOG: Pathogenesis related protein-like protein [Seminavis robusta]|uniref:Inherit from NOG: Pathogenesis related protein-like protein n=1 Tax=Seminavis robusta TaxID=568900 RepID=A0A9N8DIM8_9STRA|nr:Inherit from NOG: Pathogenesis related protein-like protein [Seminavis robusta]|eukprot:Sro147_g067900.1 Inherit from NOG: Pathogenesis related protein-like protein (317) ;mRNA; f:64146-65195